MLEAMYQDVILDHYKNPHGKGLRTPFDAQVHHINPTCGDEITLRVRLAAAETGGDDADPVVTDVSYDATGCSISQAGASVVFDVAVGQSASEVLRRYDAFHGVVTGRIEDPETVEDLIEDGVAFVGVAKYPMRVKCALLAFSATRDALAQALTARDDLAAATRTPKESTDV